MTAIVAALIGALVGFLFNYILTTKAHQYSYYRERTGEVQDRRENVYTAHIVPIQYLLDDLIEGRLSDDGERRLDEHLQSLWFSTRLTSADEHDMAEQLHNLWLRRQRLISEGYYDSVERVVKVRELQWVGDWKSRQNLEEEMFQRAEWLQFHIEEKLQLQ